jgi:hypothetical protein
VATGCSGPPSRRARWTLELLADELVRLTEHPSISRETVRRRLALAENQLKPWREDMWCIHSRTANMWRTWRMSSTFMPKPTIRSARWSALMRAHPSSSVRCASRSGPLDRLEFDYVPKHASWLNMVEIEIGVLRGQCLDRRIGTRQRLQSEILAWERQRNAARAVSNGCSQSTRPGKNRARLSQANRCPAPQTQRVITTVQRY